MEIKELYNLKKGNYLLLVDKVKVREWEFIELERICRTILMGQGIQIHLFYGFKDSLQFIPKAEE